MEFVLNLIFQKKLTIQIITVKKESKIELSNKWMINSKGSIINHELEPLDLCYSAMRGVAQKQDSETGHVKQSILDLV